MEPHLNLSYHSDPPQSHFSLMPDIHMQDVNSPHLLPSSSGHQFFHVSSPNTLMHDVHSPTTQNISNFFDRTPPNPAASIGNLTVDTVVEVTHLTHIKEAYDFGKGLHEISKATHDTKYSPMEATVCKTAKVTAELAFETVGTGVILGGIPLYLTEVAAFPPLAVTIPVVAEQLPQAYANMQEFAKFAGEKAEEDCHRLFSGDK